MRKKACMHIQIHIQKIMSYFKITYFIRQRYVMKILYKCKNTIKTIKIKIIIYRGDKVIEMHGCERYRG